MNIKRKLLPLLLCALLALSALPALPALAEIRAIDMMGREIALDEAPRRVVALTAADCEVLYAIGAGDALVGRGAYCDYPEEALALPALNSGAETNIEQILALSPQVVFMATMTQTEAQNDALEGAGVEVVVSNATDIEGVYELIRLIGTVMDRGEAAEAVVSDMESRLAAVAERATDGGKTVYFEISPLQYGLWTAGRGTFMDEIATLCGLTNVFHDVEGWAEISQEAVLERDPDYIVTVSMYYGEGPTPVEEIASRAGWDGVAAVREGGVFQIDGDTFTRPSPRLAEGAEALLAMVEGGAQ